MQPVCCLQLPADQLLSRSCGIHRWRPWRFYCTGCMFTFLLLSNRSKLLQATARIQLVSFTTAACAYIQQASAGHIPDQLASAYGLLCLCLRLHIVHRSLACQSGLCHWLHNLHHSHPAQNAACFSSRLQSNDRWQSCGVLRWLS